MLSLRMLHLRSSLGLSKVSQHLRVHHNVKLLSLHSKTQYFWLGSFSTRSNSSTSVVSKSANGPHTHATTAGNSKLTVDQILNHVSIMEQWTCSGCGIELQYNEPKQIGYFPKQVLTNVLDLKDLKRLRCERCFQMTQYGKISDTRIPYQEYERRVMELRNKDILMIQLVDILDISGSLLPNARHIFGKKPVMLVVNKGDLVPTKSGIRRLMRRIKQEAKEAGIDNIISIYLVSALKRIGMKEIIEDVAKYRQGRDICVVGAANVGKSTFLNSFLSHLVDRKWQHNHRKYMKMPEVQVSELEDEEKATMLNIDDETIAEVKTQTAAIGGEQTVVTPYGELYVASGEDPEMIEMSSEEDREMTTSPLPGTTLAVQSLPVMVRNEVFNILDTPGLITDAKRQKLIEVLALDGAAKLKNVFPAKNLPVTTYRVRPGRSLFLGALVRFDYENIGNEKNKNNLLLSWYGVLPGHLTSTERAEATFVKHAGGILSPPRGLDAMSFTGPLTLSQNLYLKDYTLGSVLTKSKPRKPKRTTVVELEIPGFGWLAVTAVDLDGTTASQKTLNQGKISIHTCRGLSVVPRTPLYPYELSDSKSTTWKR
ncbi:gtp-binding protein [Plasmopara halstedii]|uniref:Gtp-binding protein n=1 Tax=Plasmopara halstedii TaxID=4781 RepID=A0A0P1AHF4_PLAHL|nr:gtp-binding protein [Plasmopara halstedii]CEG40570.1 gtp-binding protein [Plasmopara halstedii]|eukprot:XP_024576939.1 gtp-binding protein [Plasmopara halstedii]